ncbi:MAG: HlyD family efflux transporter periplasmic adaptor subunit [Nostoc sp. NMS7]|uniref:HlyD family secretion protein n=1 Tax=Nostoc sp. NMS7 TaxID=2815391 RepID=UPI0025D6B7F9|nr:HlyD family efflux transporter periplasmic adaptor subunit [Nostoc sp. NMS7]MBN3947452.1 HlyD family efflux transporter periplasmic adaptor subunit [Nostoc sp. NMS7]
MISHSNSDYLPPIQDNEFLPPLGRWTTWGGLVLVCAVGLGVPLASVTKYKVTVKGQAVVRPAGELRLVQAATEGQVTRVFVSENQVVKKGDIIATIDNSKLQTKKSQLQSNIGQSRLQLFQINAQINAINSQVLAENERVNRVIAGAEAELSDRSRNYQDKLITTATDVEEADANVKAADASLKAAQSKRNRYETVAKAGALSQDQFEEAQLAVRQQEQALQATKAKLQNVQTALNPSNAQVAIASQRIAQEKATGQANIATLDKERQALIQQRIEIQKQLESDTRELKQVNIDLSQTVITATADGIISKLNLRNSGQTVPAGQEIAQIVPSDASLEIKAAVALQDKNKLKQGQKVQMRVSACPYPDYGTLKGKVKTISPDAIAPQGNAANATDTTSANQKMAAVGAFYEVRIEPESLSLGTEKHLCAIQLGMEGTVDIISREETVMQFFLRKARLIADL